MGKILKTILEDLEYELVQGSLDTEVEGIVCDSRKAGKGSLFICVPGAVTDGHKYAPDVVEKGASVLVTEKDVRDLLPEDKKEDVTILQVKDARYAMAFLSAAWFDHPADKMKVIGITGTKGKTTTTYMVRSVLESADYKTGLVGTIEIIMGDEHISAEHTTPESCLLQEYFAKMVEKGCQCVVMEVSSQALMLHRTQGFTFDYGIFTNLEPDHIGPAEHKDFDDYLHCKSLLFQQCKTGIFNCDDEHFEKVKEGATCDIVTYGFSEKADYRAEDLFLMEGEGLLGISFHVSGKADLSLKLHAPGRFSVYNALCAITICDQFGIEKGVMAEAVGQAKVKGRIEMIPVSKDYTLMIDYAHNAMSLESLLRTLREYKPGRLVCLFGCGGDRSKLRRFEMGEVSGKLADLTVITSDNPRTEDPQAIIDDIKTGIGKTDGEYVEIIDRREAIRYVIDNAKPRDLIVLAGKGHEDYQEINGKKYPMDERDIIRDIMKDKGMA
ncbi:MAG: UDP-N-acetylmuramoyl-L-alanyl-D-glutamate--2,6-diaminopimelate ligase [Lachnospiraceae bacterium]|nr:UDP-N-acetylmuramoyl-L-alanyl-D-glutamate--2,6-diaminopimelate ligase [Lachnospiraceae bacterium]